MSLNILCWSVFLLCQAACSSFAGLFVCRLGLGVCEGSITAGVRSTLLMTVSFSAKLMNLNHSAWIVPHHHLNVLHCTNVLIQLTSLPLLIGYDRSSSLQHAEASRRVSYWFLMNGFAQIVSGLLSFVRFVSSGCECT